MSAKRFRVASVSYTNAKPLIYGLEKQADVALTMAVPSKLAGILSADGADVALLPVIDYQRIAGLKVVPAGGIGCDGPTLTVRVFSKVAVGEIKTLAVDTESHTSIALARVILAERWGIRPAFVELVRGVDVVADARLLIGDKVVVEEPVGFEHQVDLGEAWKDLTGLPFVFAVWCARRGAELGDLPRRLARARVDGLANVKTLVDKHAVPLGWPAGLAMQYLTMYLKFEIGPRQLEAIRRFHELAFKHGVIDHEPWPLEVHAMGEAAKGMALWGQED